MRLGLVSLWRGAIDFYNSSNLTHASSIAYFGLLSLFPFLLLLLSILGTVTASDTDRAAVLNFLLRYFPRQFDFLTTQLDAFRTSRVPLGIAGSVLLIWASLGVFSAITTAVNHAWGVERQPSYWKQKLVAFLMLISSGVLMMVALTVFSVREAASTWWFALLLERTAWSGWVVGVAAHWATVGLLIVVVALLFYFVPNTHVRFRDVWFGAIVTGLLWRVALAGFTWYVSDLSRFSVHGSIATVVVFLVWIYTSSIILLYGVEVTASYARLRRESAQGEAEIAAGPAP